MKVIYALNESRSFTSIGDFSLLNDLEELKTIKEGVFVLPFSTDAMNQGSYHHYIPYKSEILKLEEKGISPYVYFDLASYSFYREAKQIIQEGEDLRGVLRFRRTVISKEDISLLAGDLFVLNKLLGGYEEIFVKKTKPSDKVFHIIVLLKFKNGAMAHVECTRTREERIEFEWSGLNDIIEFDSNEMSPFRPGEYTAYPLVHSIEVLIQDAITLDSAEKKELQNFERIIGGE